MSDIKLVKASESKTQNVPELKVDVQAYFNQVEETLPPPKSPDESSKTPRLGSITASTSSSAAFRLFSITQGGYQASCHFRIGVIFDLINELKMDLDGMENIVKGLKKIDTQAMGQNFQGALNTANNLYKRENYYLWTSFGSRPLNESIEDSRKWPLDPIGKDFESLQKRIASIQKQLNQLVSLVDNLSQTEFALSKGEWITLFAGVECSARVPISDHARLKVDAKFQAGALVDITPSGVPPGVQSVFDALSMQRSVEKLGKEYNAQANQSGALHFSAKAEIDPHTQTSLADLSKSLNGASQEFESFVNAFQGAQTVGDFLSALRKWDAWQNDTVPQVLDKTVGFATNLSKTQTIDQVITRSEPLGVSGEGELKSSLQLGSKENYLSLNIGTKGKFSRIQGHQESIPFTTTLDSDPVVLNPAPRKTTAVDNVAPFFGHPDSVAFNMGVGFSSLLGNGSTVHANLNFSQTHFFPGQIQRALEFSAGYETSKVRWNLDYQLQYKPLFLTPGFPSDCGAFSHQIGLGIFTKRVDFKGGVSWGEGRCDFKSGDSQSSVPVNQIGSYVNSVIRF